MIFKSLIFKNNKIAIGKVFPRNYKSERMYNMITVFKPNYSKNDYQKFK